MWEYKSVEEICPFLTFLAYPFVEVGYVWERASLYFSKSLEKRNSM